MKRSEFKEQLGISAKVRWDKADQDERQILIREINVYIARPSGREYPRTLRYVKKFNVLPERFQEDFREFFGEGVRHNPPDILTVHIHKGCNGVLLGEKRDNPARSVSICEQSDGQYVLDGGGFGYQHRKDMAKLGWHWVRGLGGPGAYATRDRKVAESAAKKMGISIVMRLGFTGTLRGMSLEQFNAVKEMVRKYKPTEFHHGDAIGADKQAHTATREARPKTKIVIHPPLDASRRAFTLGDRALPEKPYLERNQDIVNSVEVMVATPRGFREELRSGTWSTIRYATKKGVSIHIIYPDGSVETRAKGFALKFGGNGEKVCKNPITSHFHPPHPESMKERAKDMRSQGLPLRSYLRRWSPELWDPIQTEESMVENPAQDVKLLVGDEPRREVDMNRPTGYNTPFQKTLRRTVKIKDIVIDCHSFPTDAAYHDTDGWNDSDIVLLETVGVTDKVLMKALYLSLVAAGFKAKMDISKKVNQIQITSRLLRARTVLLELNEKHLKSGKLTEIAKVIAHTLTEQHELQLEPSNKSVKIQDPKSNQWKTVPEYLKGHGFAVPNPGPPVLEHHPAQSDTPLQNAIAAWKTFQQLPVDKTFKMTIPDIPSSMVYMGRVHALTYHCSKWSRTEGVSSDLSRNDNIVADNVNINYRHQWKQNNPHLFKYPSKEIYYIWGELRVLGVGVDDSDRPNPRPLKGSKIDITVPSHVGLIGDLKSIELLPEDGGKPLIKTFSNVLLAMDGEGAYRHLYFLKGTKMN